MRKLIVCFVLASLALPSYAWAYDWPLKPFDRQHPIRGGFNDPRIASRHIDGPGGKSWHFGVDISAPDGTAVYAVASGKVYVESSHPETVQVTNADKSHTFGYWHVRPVVRTGMYVSAHQLVGYILPGWGHVHLSEWRSGSGYLNPLRRGGLAPYVDRVAPTVASLEVHRMRTGRSISSGEPATGRIDLVVSAYDLPSLRPSGVWHHAVLSPTVIAWRVSDRYGRTVHQGPTIDLSTWSKLTLTSVYAPGTRQNGPKTSGDYRFWLTSGWDTRTVPDGAYNVVVTVSDVRDNRTTRRFPLRIGNHPIPEPVPEPDPPIELPPPAVPDEQPPPFEGE